MHATRLLSRASRLIKRTRRSSGEIAHAQGRMFELRTGISSPATAQRPRSRPRIQELEALYALPAREPDDNAA